jgi:hypothetical protein
VDDDPIGLGLGGQSVDDGAFALEVFGAHREHVGRTVRAMRLVAGSPRQFLGRGVVIDDDEEIDVAVTGCFAAGPASRTGSPAAA